MRFRNIAFIVLMVCVVPYQLFAWGNAGHRIVAKIAYNQLKPAVKDSINKYLQLAHIEDAGTWMDDVRSDPSYAYMSTWHYINIEKGHDGNLDSLDKIIIEAGKNVKDVHDVPDSVANIIWAINRAITELENRQNLSKDQIALDIKMLFHLVGDLHQPLHVGYGVDRGGNSIVVYVHNQPSNLHRVWDTDMIESDIMGHPTTWADLSKYNKEQLAGIRHVDINQWLADSRTKLGIVYDYKGDNINQKYIDRNVPVVEEQLLKAGLRLASLLNQIFAPQTGNK
jgi:S1/P1 Nuclease